MKNGSGKPKVTSNDEIARLLQSSKIMFADEFPVPGATIADLNLELYKDFIHTKYGRSFEDLGVDLQSSLESLNLSKGGVLILTGLLLFSNHRQTLRPQFTIQCVSIDDLVVTGNSFSDGESPIDGNILNVYQKAMGFIDRNMRKIQTGTSLVGFRCF